MSNDLLEEAIIVIDQDECKACGYCIESCPVKVLYFSKKLNSKGFHPAEYKGEGCTGCGVCFYTCPEPGAIAVFKKGVKKEEVNLYVERINKR